MIIFINNKSTKFCHVTLRIKRFIHKRKVAPFFYLAASKAFKTFRHVNGTEFN